MTSLAKKDPIIAPPNVPNAPLPIDPNLNAAARHLIEHADQAPVEIHSNGAPADVLEKLMTDIDQLGLNTQECEALKNFILHIGKEFAEMAQSHFDATIIVTDQQPPKEDGITKWVVLDGSGVMGAVIKAEMQNTIEGTKSSVTGYSAFDYNYLKNGHMALRIGFTSNRAQDSKAVTPENMLALNVVQALGTSTPPQGLAQIRQMINMGTMPPEAVPVIRAVADLVDARGQALITPDGTPPLKPLTSDEKVIPITGQPMRPAVTEPSQAPVTTNSVIAQRAETVATMLRDQTVRATLPPAVLNAAITQIAPVLQPQDMPKIASLVGTPAAPTPSPVTASATLTPAISTGTPIATNTSFASPISPTVQTAPIATQATPAAAVVIPAPGISHTPAATVPASSVATAIQPQTVMTVTPNSVTQPSTPTNPTPQQVVTQSAPQAAAPAAFEKNSILAQPAAPAAVSPSQPITSHQSVAPVVAPTPAPAISISTTQPTEHITRPNVIIKNDIAAPTPLTPVTSFAPVIPSNDIKAPVIKNDPAQIPTPRAEAFTAIQRTIPDVQPSTSPLTPPSIKTTPTTTLLTPDTPIPSPIKTTTPPVVPPIMPTNTPPAPPRNPGPQKMPSMTPPPTPVQEMKKVVADPERIKQKMLSPNFDPIGGGRHQPIPTQPINPEQIKTPPECKKNFGKVCNCKELEKAMEGLEEKRKAETLSDTYNGCAGCITGECEAHAPPPQKKAAFGKTKKPKQPEPAH